SPSTSTRPRARSTARAPSPVLPRRTSASRWGAASPAAAAATAASTSASASAPPASAVRPCCIVRSSLVAAAPTGDAPSPCERAYASPATVGSGRTTRGVAEAPPLGQNSTAHPARAGATTQVAHVSGLPHRRGTELGRAPRARVGRARHHGPHRPRRRRGRRAAGGAAAPPRPRPRRRDVLRLERARRPAGHPAPRGRGRCRRGPASGLRPGGPAPRPDRRRRVADPRVSPGRGATIGGAGAPAPAPAWPRYAAAALVVVLGIAVAVGLHRAALDQAAEREALVADRTANVVAATLEQLPATVAGTPSLVGPDGEVDLDAFATYAEGAIEASPFQALAVVLEVPADQRPAFEREVGGPPAGPRDRPLAVRAVAPPDRETTAPLIGVDLPPDEVRRATLLAARDTGTTAVSGTIHAVPSGSPAVFVAHPLYRSGRPPATTEERREEIVGYVTSGLLGTGLLEAVERNVGDPVGLRIEDPESGRTLSESDPAPGSGITVVRHVADRSWRITVDDRQSVSLAGPAVTVAGAGALAAALALLGRRAQRHQRDVTRHVELLDGIASLGRSLAAAGSVDDLTAVVRAE